MAKTAFFIYTRSLIEVCCRIATVADAKLLSATQVLRGQVVECICIEMVTGTVGINWGKPGFRPTDNHLWEKSLVTLKFTEHKANTSRQGRQDLA